jgi:hypothetical protein
MFILRSLFWLSTLVILLPASPDGGEPPRVNLLHTAYSVRVIVQDVTGVCERNPEACSASREALVLLTQKLATGADIVTASVKAGQNYQFARPNTDHGTLTAADLEPMWSVADAMQ